MRGYTTVISLLLFGTAAFAQPPTYNETAAKDRCEKNWGTDFTMVEFCLNEDKSAFFQFAARGEDLTDRSRLFYEPFNFCRREWGLDWSMVEFCAGEQVAAWDALQITIQSIPEDIGRSIQFRCAADWDPNITMIDFCAEEQAKSWRALND